MSDKPERPVFCGNFEYDASERDIWKLFEKYGDVDRIDMKTGFAFVYMRNKRDAEDAIHSLDRKEFGYKKRPLRVEWAKKEEARRREQKPSVTLFVVNFDVRRTREADLERYFERYGRLRRVEIKRNYAFVQYDNIDHAVEAMKHTHNSTFMGRNITVEYVTNEDPHSRVRSPPRSPYRGRERSRSPYSRDRYAGRSPRRSVSPRRYDREPAPRGRSASLSRSRSRSPYNGYGSPPKNRSASRSPDGSR